MASIVRTIRSGELNSTNETLRSHRQKLQSGKYVIDYAPIGSIQVDHQQQLHHAVDTVYKSLKTASAKQFFRPSTHYKRLRDQYLVAWSHFAHGLLYPRVWDIQVTRYCIFFKLSRLELNSGSHKFELRLIPLPVMAADVQRL